jgi:hypothetical protein
VRRDPEEVIAMSNPDTPQNPENPPPGQYSAPPPGGYAAPPPAGGQYGAPPPAGAPVPGQPPVTESDERTWAMLGHIGGILIGFIAGLVVYLIYKDRSQYLKQQGAEALNFQLTILIGYIAAWILATVTFGILFILPFVVWVLQIVFGIIAGLAANKHENYRYPFRIQFVR